MTSKIQQAKNEKQLKELARLSENKRCAICTCMGTQYTCQPPHIFVCSVCAGAIYHFPGFRVKSRSMATYSTTEVQQMREGGNAAFQRNYLAKWNASSFPAPTDKNPKKVEEFIRQVMVEKVFYSDSPEEQQQQQSPQSEPVKHLPDASLKRSLAQQTPAAPAENSWKPFSDEGPTTNSGQSSTTIATGAANWAEFPSVTTSFKSQAPHPPPPPPQQQQQPFDPFSEGSPVQTTTSPKSAHSTPADPFAPPPQRRQQTQDQAWDPFLHSASGPVPSTHQQPQQQTTWSQFESKPVEVHQQQSIRRVASIENPVEAFTPASAQNGSAKMKAAPVMSPLPEEWFANPAPEMQHTGTPPFAQPDPHAFPQQQQSTFTGSSAFTSPPYQQQGGGYGGGALQPGAYAGTPPGNAFGAVPQQGAYGYSPQASRPALGSYPSFRSTTSSTHQHWQQQPPPPQQQGFVTMQKQDSMTSYVSHRVDEASHNSLFQNLDMDMRAKAHSVAGVPIQTSSHMAFQTAPTGAAATAFNRSGNASFQQPFFQAPPQTGFDEATGNPFA